MNKKINSRYQRIFELANQDIPFEWKSFALGVRLIDEACEFEFSAIDLTGKEVSLPQSDDAGEEMMDILLALRKELLGFQDDAVWTKMWFSASQNGQFNVKYSYDSPEIEIENVGMPIKW